MNKPYGLEIKIFFLIVTMISSFLFTRNVFAFSGNGAGSVGDPFQITTCSELQEMNLDLDAHYVLLNDIDCAETATWNVNLDEWVDGDTDNALIPDSYTGVINNGYFGFDPIGRDNAASFSGPGFTGTFNGNGHTISNLWIFRKLEPHVGLFGYATGATIENVTLDNAQVVGQQNAGMFVGYGSGTVLNDLTNTGGMVRAYLSYRGGGIAGLLESNSSIDNVQVIGGTVHGSGNVIGGLVGYLGESTVTDSHTSAAVDGGEFIGGAFGDVINSQVTAVYATGNVVSNLSEGIIAKSGNYTGGFAGHINNSTIADSYATGSVDAEGNYAGGFAGLIDGNTVINNSYATGSVTSDASQVGGFAGQVFGSSTFTDVYSTGLVSGVSTIGGFVGGAYCGPTFTRVYASGNVVATGDYVGGFAGSDGCEGPGALYSQARASGSVTGANRVGGFSGESYYSDFTDVYAGGDVTGSDQVGGFGGYIYEPKMTNAYSRGNVTGEGVAQGGFIGIHYIGTEDRIITDSFFDIESSGQLAACGDGDCSLLTGKTTTDMKTLSTFTDAGWDFDTIWEIDLSNDGYPHFIFETFDGEPSDTTAPVLTVIKSIASRTLLSDAYLEFTTDETCSILAEQPTSTTGSVELTFSASPVPETTIRGTLSGMRAGGTYSFRFLCKDSSDNASTIIDSGSFTVIDSGSSGSSSSGYSAAFAWQPVTQSLVQEIKQPKTLKYKMTDPAVVILQQWLNKKGFIVSNTGAGSPGKESHYFGIKTLAAVKKFQKANGLKADGVVGPKTWTVLEK